MLVEVQYEAHRHERRHEFQRLTGAAAGVLSRASMLMRRRSPLNHRPDGGREGHPVRQWHDPSLNEPREEAEQD